MQTQNNNLVTSPRKIPKHRQTMIEALKLIIVGKSIKAQQKLKEASKQTENFYKNLNCGGKGNN